MMRSQPRVQAIVLTHNSSDALERCVAALARQSVPPSEILIVDNASSPAVGVHRTCGVDARVVTLPENVGPAGGYAAALIDFAQSSHDFAWLVDDDCETDEHALEHQLAAGSAGDIVVLATMLDRATGALANTHGWCGVLVPRSVVDIVGVPNADLFWWTEDTEYLQWRIPNGGFEVLRCESAIVTVNRTRTSLAKPPWKYYYEARNQVFYRLHTQGRQKPDQVPHHLRLRVRSWRALRTVLKLSWRAVRREDEQRRAKLVMVGRGTYDGVRGRLGRTVSADSADRPMDSPG